MTSSEGTVPSDTLLGMFFSTAPQITCIMTFLSPWRTIQGFKQERTTKDLPFLPYISLAVQSFIWSNYGLLIGALPVILPNVVGTLLGIYYVYIFHSNYTLGVKYMLAKHYIGSAVVLLALFFFLTQDPDVAKQYIALMGMTGTVIFSASPLIMIYTVCVTKSVAALPFDMALLVFVNSTFWILYGVFVVNDYAIYLPNMLGFLAGFLQLSCHVLFGDIRGEVKQLVQCQSKTENIEFLAVNIRETELS
mmetsp:Transcript_5053/g.5844  ORF Transcript_5053/g.5844 Transcript_5053/m.5844 type:complete len:249 (-) Transcript_5053:611-1357(-)